MKKLKFVIDVCSNKKSLNPNYFFVINNLLY